MRYDAHHGMLPIRAFQRRGSPLHGSIVLHGGGKGSTPDAPDYTPLANASAEAAAIGAELGREQLAENKRQYALNMEVAKPIIDAQTDVLNQSKAQGDDYFNYMKDTFRPVEKELVDEAMSGKSRYETNASVRANIENEATRAEADVARASANAQSQNQRAILAMGANPNSGKFAALKVGEGLATAAAKASAQTTSRTQGVALDYAKRMDVTGLGRGLPGASTGAYSVATSAGNSAVNNQNQTAAQYINGISAGNSTIMQGQGMQVQGLGNVLNSQTSVYNAQLNANAQAGAGTGALIGGLAMAGATY